MNFDGNNISHNHETTYSNSTSASNASAKKPPALVLPTISCPLICEQGPSIPSSPTFATSNGILPPDIVSRLNMFTTQFDNARLSPNYATSDLGSSARSSFSTASSSFMAYRDRSVDFDETGKELISPFDCDTACSVSPSFSLSPNSFNHFSFDARSVSSLCHSSNNLNQLLTVGGLELTRERSRSESDMLPKDEDPISHSTISVPCCGKKSTLFKYSQEPGKRSSSTPPPTTSERDEIERRATSRLESQEEVDATNLLVSNWARDQLLALQTANMYNQVVSSLLSVKAASSTTLDEPTTSMATPTAILPKPTVVTKNQKTKEEYTPRDEASRALQMQYTCQLCGQAFAVHDRLAKHIASRHRQNSCSLDDAAKVHKCRMCSKSFSRSDMLTRHMRLHTGAKPYSCPTCAQVFSRSDHLSTHLRTHTGEKPYACPLCSYSASRRDMISRHMRTHSMGDTSSSCLDVSAPIALLSIRSATTSPIPPKVQPVVEIGSGELSAFKPITTSSSTSNFLSVHQPFQLSFSTPSSPSFLNSNHQSSFDPS